jgi:predicted transcriptional regulator
MNTRKKNEVKVVAKILRVAAKGSKEAEIMDRCKLDSMSVENYLSALSELSFLTVEDENEMYCRTTEKGLEFLNTYHRLRWLLFGKDNDFLLMRLLEQMKKKDNSPFYVS